ncbi:hypothetical protein [Mitsuaria sp. 7]|uniref:hypothetical protein n=1 Tax=Mitsuaria sp. 7 TaxID=1658665 RepID=UPI0007DE2138|nr:hypothetical protein [Mitsuaria sp. 7]ANH66415.1 hypothetical protein ABE85_00515 [Mitsuaria sp. 7]
MRLSLILEELFNAAPPPPFVPNAFSPFYGLFGLNLFGYGSIGHTSWLTSKPATCDVGPYAAPFGLSSRCEDTVTASDREFELVRDAFTSAFRGVAAWAAQQQATTHDKSIDAKAADLPPILIKETPDMFRQSTAASDLVGTGGVPAGLGDTTFVPGNSPI